MSYYLFFLEGQLTLGALEGCTFSYCSHSAFSQLTFTPKQACVVQKGLMKNTTLNPALEVGVGLGNMGRRIEGIPCKNNKANKGIK